MNGANKESDTPRISVIIPVLHEGHRINRVIAHVREIAHHIPTEIIVVDGNPGGDTLQAITHTGIIPVPSPAGRGPQMNQGARRAKGEILLFLHADTYLPDKALEKALKSMERPEYGAGAFRLGIDAPGLSFRIIEWFSLLRCRLSRVPFGDQAIFIRKSYFHEIGEYKEIPLMEDVELMVRIRAKGHRIVLLPDKVRTSARRWQEEGIVRCVIRNWALRVLYVLGVSPARLAGLYKNSREGGAPAGS